MFLRHDARDSLTTARPINTGLYCLVRLGDAVSNILRIRGEYVALKSARFNAIFRFVTILRQSVPQLGVETDLKFGFKS